MHVVIMRHTAVLTVQTARADRTAVLLCFWMCFFTHWSCLSFPLSQNEKPLGHSASRSSNISKVSKAHTSGRIWMNDVWPASSTQREEGEHKRQEGSGEVSHGRRQRLTGQKYMQWSASSWLITCRSHCPNQRCLCDQSPENRPVFTPQLLSSLWLSVREALQTSPLYVLLYFLSSSLTLLSAAPPGNATACESNLTPGLQSLFSWASYRINPLLVLIDVGVTSTPWDRSGNNVWSTSQSLFKRERGQSYCTRVTNTPALILMVTVMVQHKYCFQTQCSTSKTMLSALHKLTHWSLVELMISDFFNLIHNLRLSNLIWCLSYGDCRH